jgi:hypothetical protein
MEDEIKKAAFLAARVFESALRSQSPKKTGQLERSIKVTPLFTDDSVKFQSSYVTYGKYLDLGTGPYKTRASSRRAWNPKPGKGKGGIKPRFWTSIKQSTRDSINKMISDAFMKVIRTTLYRQK